MTDDRIWVNEERTVMVRMWASGAVEVATRLDSSHTWGPPINCEEETEKSYWARVAEVVNAE